VIYVEYISRRPGVSLEAFHKIMRLGPGGWADEHAADVPVLMLGRTWRLGPEPEYMCVWHSAAAGFERIDDWERVFRAGEADAVQQPFDLAARIDRAGCYDALIEPRPSASERFYGEFFDWQPGAERDAVTAHFAERSARHDAAELCLLIDRVGHLGPEPRGLAFWALPEWAALAGIARDTDSGGPVRTVTAGTYSAVGRETL
jgi:hypothetical protein